MRPRSTKIGVRRPSRSALGAKGRQGEKKTSKRWFAGPPGTPPFGSLFGHFGAHGPTETSKNHFSGQPEPKNAIFKNIGKTHMKITILSSRVALVGQIFGPRGGKERPWSAPGAIFFPIDILVDFWLCEIMRARAVARSCLPLKHPRSQLPQQIKGTRDRTTDWSMPHACLGARWRIKTQYHYSLGPYSERQIRWTDLYSPVP